jgi:tetratricopeptide (TPR) repeat protein
MKRIVVVVVLVFCAMAGFGQKGKSTPPKPSEAVAPKEDPTERSRAVTAQIIIDHYARKYAFAQRWGDYEVSKDALYDLISEFPGNDSLIFQLAYFYYENQKHASCAVVCNDLLARNSKNTAALELSAISYENLGIKDKALQNYESLFLITSNNSMLYKMASLQYDLKRYAESLTNSDILLSKPQTDSLKVVFSDAKNNSKEYPLKAAILNLKGLSYKAQGDTPAARKSFEEALKIDPAFEAAKQNLASLK